MEDDTQAAKGQPQALVSQPQPVGAPQPSQQYVVGANGVIRPVTTNLPPPGTILVAQPQPQQQQQPMQRHQPQVTYVQVPLQNQVPPNYSYNNNYTGDQQYLIEEAKELPEAAVAKPLSIISLFCFFQIWFSIPAIVFAYSQRSNRKKLNTSIALSITAIVIGMCATIVMASFGLVMPYISCYWDNQYGWNCYSN